MRLTVDAPEETWIHLKVATAEYRATIKDLFNQLIEIYLEATDVRAAFFRPPRRGLGFPLSFGRVPQRRPY